MLPLHKTGVAQYCHQCSVQIRRIGWPPKEELERLLWEMPMTKIGKIYSKSDRIIKKISKIYGLDLPPHGYWLAKDKGF